MAIAAETTKARLFHAVSASPILPIYHTAILSMLRESLAQDTKAPPLNSILVLSWDTIATLEIGFLHSFTCIGCYHPCLVTRISTNEIFDLTLDLS